MDKTPEISIELVNEHKPMSSTGVFAYVGCPRQESQSRWVADVRLVGVSGQELTSGFVRVPQAGRAVEFSRSEGLTYPNLVAQLAAERAINRALSAWQTERRADEDRAKRYRHLQLLVRNRQAKIHEMEREVSEHSAEMAELKKKISFSSLIPSD